MSGPGYIAEEALQVCELCRTVEECRPYGPNGEQICYSCGMKDLATTIAKMEDYIFNSHNKGIE